MADNTIIKYLKEGIKKGYSLNSLKEALLKQGYPSADVDNAIKKVSGMEREPKKPAKILFILLVVIGIVLLLYFGVKLLGPKKAALEGLEPWEEDLWQELLEYASTSSEYSGYYAALAADFAFKQNNPLICDIFRTEELKENCFMSIAEKYGDFSVCDKIETEEIKDSCFRFGAERSKDFSSCSKISDLGERGRCYGSSNDISLCDDFFSEDPRWRSECYSYVARSTNNTEVCEELSGIDREWCYMGVAGGGDSSVCEKMSEEWSNICLAVINDDVAYCEKIINQNMKLVCTAKLTNDASTCEKVEYENYLINKEVCYDLLELTPPRHPELGE